MNKGSQVRFRIDSPLASALAVPSGALGTVICKYRIDNGIIGSAERVDVRFLGNKVAWGAPVIEFILAEMGDSNSETFSQVA